MIYRIVINVDYLEYPKELLYRTLEFKKMDNTTWWFSAAHAFDPTATGFIHIFENEMAANRQYDVWVSRTSDRKKEVYLIEAKAWTKNGAIKKAIGNILLSSEIKGEIISHFNSALIKDIPDCSVQAHIEGAKS